MATKKRAHKNKRKSTMRGGYRFKIIKQELNMIKKKLASNYHKYMYPNIPMPNTKNEIYNKSIRSLMLKRDLPQYAPMMTNKYNNYNPPPIADTISVDDSLSKEEPLTAKDVQSNITEQTNAMLIDAQIDIVYYGATEVTADQVNAINKNPSKNIAMISSNIANALSTIKTYGSKLVPAFGMIPTAAKLTYSQAIQYELAYNAVQNGLYQQICHIINMSYNNTDWTQKKNLNDYYVTLIKIILPVFEIIFDKYIQSGCEMAIPKLLERIINPTTAKAVVNISNSNFQQLMQETFKTCNSVVPKLAKHIQTTDFFERGVSEDVRNELNEYIQSFMGLFKKIVIDVLEDSKIKIVKSLHEELKKSDEYIIVTDDLDNILDREFIDYLYNNAKELHDNMHKLNNAQIKEVVTEIHNNDNKMIKSDVNNLSNVVQKKLTIYDFYSNWKDNSIRLCKAWAEELDKHEYSKSDKHFTANCILNLIDLRIHVVVKDVCKIIKMQNKMCDENTFNMLEMLSTTEINNMDDVYDVLKYITVNAVIDRINAFKDLSFIKKMTLFFSEPTLDIQSYEYLHLV